MQCWAIKWSIFSADVWMDCTDECSMCSLCCVAFSLICMVIVILSVIWSYSISDRLSLCAWYRVPNSDSLRLIHSTSPTPFLSFSVPVPLLPLSFPLLLCPCSSPPLPLCSLVSHATPLSRSTAPHSTSLFFTSLCYCYILFRSLSSQLINFLPSPLNFSPSYPPFASPSSPTFSSYPFFLPSFLPSSLSLSPSHPLP